uniref:Putative ovule protein n=1 Tax=Solanum chacoense TaxID=4108 RepID=A0A0V0H1I7_SOLCH
MRIVGYAYVINLSFHVFNRQFDASYVRSSISFGHIFVLIYGSGLEMLCLIVKLAAPTSKASWLCTWFKI